MPRFRSLLLLFLLSCIAFPASATTIRVQATDLNDAGGPGGDLWEYAFTVSGRTFDTDIGFSVLFDPLLYSNLQIPPVGPSPDWDVIVLQPDALLPADGLYDALALVDGATLAIAFTVEFIWLGGPGALPGTSLPFTVQQFASDGSLVAVLESGGSTVPEPALVGLLLLSVAGLEVLRRV